MNLADLKNVIDLVGTAIMILDVRDDGSLHYGFLNQAAEQFFGISNEVYAGKLIEHYKGADTERGRRRVRTIEMYQQCITNRQSVVFDLEHVLFTGETRWGRHTVAPIFDQDTQWIRRNLCRMQGYQVREKLGEHRAICLSENGLPRIQSWPVPKVRDEIPGATR